MGLSRDERRGIGRELRRETPRSAHAGWSAPADRVDPLTILETQARSRVPDLIPIRHGRMAVSPNAFYRGAAAIMAADIATTPSSGIVVQACGDAHLSNFGMFASPERQLVFDINDFDETHPAPWEWDLKRLVASVAVVGRSHGMRRAETLDAVRATVAQYRETIQTMSELRTLEVWYSQFGVDANLEALRTEIDNESAALLEAQLAKTRRNDTIRAFSKMTELVNGRRRIIDSPPLVIRVDPAIAGEVLDHQLHKYRESLRPDIQSLLDRFTLVDFARKVVGVGSIGTRCWIALFEGGADDDPLFLQIKEAQPSVLAPYTAPVEFESQGQRVVQGQRLMQANSDVLLGWSVVESSGVHYYWRQLRDMKGSIPPEHLGPANFTLYVRLCATSLGRGHAKGGDASLIAGYVGKSHTLDDAMAEFAVDYAAQNEADYPLSGRHRVRSPPRGDRLIVGLPSNASRVCGHP